MSFSFFTWGGGQFWEDVFFYQKWRIQRNCYSKKYRLLDNWDIRRHQGTFEDCRKAFVNFIEINEISRQKGHMVIMLHALGETKNVFKPLWRALIAEGYLAAAINYPSTRKNIESHVRQLSFLLNNLEDVTEISFVTKGCGGIILRKLLNLNAPWQEKLKINKVVMISPPNSGSRLFAKLANYKIFRFLLGPMISEVTPENIKKFPALPKETSLGIITYPRIIDEIAAFLPKSWGNILSTTKSADIDGISDKINMKNNKLNVFNNRKMTHSIVNFIRKGKF